MTAPAPFLDADPTKPAAASDQHAVWQGLCAQQAALLPGRAADEFIIGVGKLGLDRQCVPSLEEASIRLQAVTGWKLVRTYGVVSVRDFFGALAQRTLPCVEELRGQQEMDRPTTPDYFHDLFGQAPLLCEPAFASFLQKLGQCSASARDAAVEEALLRIYRYTAQIGVIKSAHGIRYYGHFLVTSWQELQRPDASGLKLWPFRPGVVADQAYDIWHFKNLRFVIDSFPKLDEDFTAWAVKHRHL